MRRPTKKWDWDEEVDDDRITGRISLPAFSPRDGKLGVEVELEAVHLDADGHYLDDDDDALPDIDSLLAPAQRNALEHLVANEVAVRNAVLDAILAWCAAEDYRTHYPTREALAPEVQFNDVKVSGSDYRDGCAPIVFGASMTDDEHGVAVAVHQGGVLKVDDGDLYYRGWRGDED